MLIIGDGSWSIDHQRYNFQFGGQMFYEVKSGKIAHALRDVAYQANTLEFWNCCDMIGGPESWELHGSLNDGKGEPGQSNAVSHGCPPARFRDVNILNTGGKEGVTMADANAVLERLTGARQIARRRAPKRALELTLGREANTRFAANEITTAGDTDVNELVADARVRQAPRDAPPRPKPTRAR